MSAEIHSDADARMARIEEQLSLISSELAAARRQREELAELKDDLLPSQVNATPGYRVLLRVSATGKTWMAIAVPDAPGASSSSEPLKTFGLVEPLAFTK